MQAILSEREFTDSAAMQLQRARTEGDATRWRKRESVVQKSCLKQQCCTFLREFALFYSSNKFCSFAVGSGASETVLFHTRM